MSAMIRQFITEWLDDCASFQSWQGPSKWIVRFFLGLGSLLLTLIFITDMYAQAYLHFIVCTIIILLYMTFEVGALAWLRTQIRWGWGKNNG